MSPSQVATRAPTPLQEPHAVDDAARAEPPPIAVPTKHATSSSQAHRAAFAKAKAMAASKPQGAAKMKPAAVPPKVAAKPGAKSGLARPRLAAKPKPVPRKLAQPRVHHPRMLAQTPHRARPMREARRDFPEERPHSGPVYEAPPDAAMPPSATATQALANGCDETCQYRDWLNRYAAWYRDFGHYYYGASPRGAASGRPPPPMTYSENRPAPATASPVIAPPAYRPDQGERDRLDPWHGYNSHSPDNGY